MSFLWHTRFKQIKKIYLKCGFVWIWWIFMFKYVPASVQHYCHTTRQSMISVPVSTDRVGYLTTKPLTDRTQINHTQTSAWTGDKLTTSQRAIHQGAGDSKRRMINITFFTRAHTILAPQADVYNTSLCANIKHVSEGPWIKLWIQINRVRFCSCSVTGEVLVVSMLLSALTSGFLPQLSFF